MIGFGLTAGRLQDVMVVNSSLEGIVGVASLGGTRMPWADVLASAGALASALGISVEADH